MNVNLDGTCFEVSPLSPRLAPFNMLYSELIQQKVSTIEEAKALSSQIKEVISLILNATVTPEPSEKHQTQLYNAVTELTQKALTQKFFPELPAKSDVSFP